MFTRKVLWLSVAAACLLVAEYAQATVIDLDDVIIGSNASDKPTLAQPSHTSGSSYYYSDYSATGHTYPVQKVGQCNDSNLTNTGGEAWFSWTSAASYSDGLNRAGDGLTAGTLTYSAKYEWNSGATETMQFDLSNNGTFTTSTDGFGTHANAFITFDLSVIRAANGLASNQTFQLTGGAGTRFNMEAKTSGLILVNGTLVKTMDWYQKVGAAGYHAYDTYDLSIAGTSRYLTFAGVAGLDNTISYDHVGFNNVQLTVTTPEPGTIVLLTTGLIGLLAYAWRKRRCVPS